MLKIKANPDQDIFVTSDTHYNHANICAGTSEWTGKRNVRNFDSLAKMNDHIVNQINNLVKQDDILIHVGDWSFGGFENIEIFRKRLVCNNIILILGNHDDHIADNKNNYQDLFTLVHPGSLWTKIVDKDGYGGMFVINHYPIASWRDMKKGVPHIFGHHHFPPNLKLQRGKAMDVGMDGNNFTPYNIKEVRSILDKQPINFTVLPEDHHLDGDKSKK